MRFGGYFEQSGLGLDVLRFSTLPELFAGLLDTPISTLQGALGKVRFWHTILLGAQVINSEHNYSKTPKAVSAGIPYTLIPEGPYILPLWN